MRKLLLMAFAGLTIMVAVPQAGSTSPLMPGGGLAATAGNVAFTQEVRWYHRHHWRHRYWRHRYWHRRHWRRW